MTASRDRSGRDYDNAGFGNVNGESEGQVWRLSTESEWWREEGGADAERPFTQSLRADDHDGGGGSAAAEAAVFASPSRSGSSGSMGSRVQVMRTLHVHVHVHVERVT